MTKIKKKTKKPNPGNKFANNSVIFTIIILILVLMGYFYRYFVPPQPESTSQVPSQPEHTLTEPQPGNPDQDSKKY